MKIKNLILAALVSLFVGQAHPTGQTWNGGMPILSEWPTFNGFPTFSATSNIADSAGDAWGYVFQVPKTGTILRIGFRAGTVTTGNAIEGALQTLDATTGLPSGTLYGGCSSGTYTVGAGDASTAVYIEMGTGASAVKGDYVAAVFSFNTYVAGNFQVTNHGANNSMNQPWPYSFSSNAGAAYGKGTGGVVGWVEYSDGSYAYIPQLWPHTAVTVNAFNNTSSPDKIATAFWLPFPATYSGAFLASTFSQDFDIALYEGTTERARDHYDDDYFQGTTGRFSRVVSTNSYALTANTTYYLSFEPATASNVTLYLVTYSTLAAFNGMMNQSEGGTNVYLSSETDTVSSWATNTNMRPILVPVLNVFDDATGSGGGGGVSQKVWGGGF